MLKALHAERRSKFHHSQSYRDNERIQKRIAANEGKLEYVSKFLDQYFGAHVNAEILISLAKIVMSNYQITLDRLAKRNRSALLCWYSENWDKIHPMLTSMNILGSRSSKLVNEIPPKFTNSFDEIKIQSNEYHDPFSLDVLLNCH